jgi:GT2 family glycosyltransferase
MNSPVMISVLCGPERDGWLNPALAESIVAAVAGCQAEERNVAVDFTFGLRPIERARNTTVEKFLKSSCKWLVQIDNDQYPNFKILDLIKAAEENAKFIVGAPTPIAYQKGAVWNCAVRAQDDPTRSCFYKTLPKGWFRPDYCGTGLIAVRRSVFETIKAPWYTSNISISEDFNFCRKAQASGFEVWAHADFCCSHLKTCDLRDLMVRNP